MPYHQLKIFAPIDRVEEALPLIRAGADEFYCGVLINNENLGSARGGESSLSAKKAYNLSSLKALRELTRIIKKNKKSIYVAFNRPALHNKKIGIIENSIEKIKAMKIDGVILSNLTLMKKFRNSGLKIIASSLLESKNEETIKFLKERGAKRIIFDRQITLNDLKAVCNFPEIEFEVFIMAAGCTSLASYCLTHNLSDFHNTKLRKVQATRHLCQGNFFVKNQKNGNNLNYLSLEDKELIAKRLKLGRGFPSCGACAMFYFRKYKITSLKIVGRGFSTDQKIRNVKFTKNTRDILEKNYPPKKFYEKVGELFEKTFGQRCNRRCCYYPHFFN